jgi:hypothetical protein
LIKPVKQPQTSILVNKKFNTLKNDPQTQQVYETQMQYGYTTTAKPLQETQEKMTTKKSIKGVNRVHTKEEFQDSEMK